MEPNYPKPITVKGPHKGFVKGSPYRLEHQAFVEGKLEGNPLNPWSQAAYWQNRRFSHWALFMSFFFIGGIVGPEFRKMIGAGH